MKEAALVCIMGFVIGALLTRLFAQRDTIENLKEESASMKRIIGHMERENQHLRRLCGLE